MCMHIHSYIVAQLMFGIVIRMLKVGDMEEVFMFDLPTGRLKMLKRY